jgi:hypothetical protein
MEGQHWIVRNEDQRKNAMRQLERLNTPFAAKFGPVHSPKTTKQIRYAHSLCNALAAYKQVSPEIAKRDAKVEFGVVVVCTSIITGDRGARLKSFADYTREEMEVFITQMTAYLDMNLIPYTPSEG